MGIKEYRQTAFKPYRVIYRVEGSRVIIYLLSPYAMRIVSAQRAPLPKADIFKEHGVH